MARGKKNLTLDEQLAKLNIEIVTTETKLSEMREIKKQLEEQIKFARLSEIDKIMLDKNISFEQLQEILCTTE